MFRCCKFLARTNFLHNSSIQLERLSFYHAHLIQKSLTLDPRNNQNDSSYVLARNLSLSSIMFQAIDTKDEILKTVESATTTISTSNVSSNKDDVVAPVSESIVPNETLQEAVEVIAKDPTLADLGLGGASPIGYTQIVLEYIHTTSGLPWWVCIGLCTLTIRILVFPLYIKSQKNIALMSKYMPLTAKMNEELTMARQRGDHYEAARLSQELALYMREHNINPLKSMIVPMVQAPIFLCFFMALRQMANAPVESMRTGGYSWFLDLTVPDQFYILPILTSVTLWITLEIGADMGKMPAMSGPFLKYGLRAIPVIIFPFTLHFPGAILVYWLSTNSISLFQAVVLKIPGLKESLGIPQILSGAEMDEKKKKGFVTEVKSSWSNMKILNEISERERIDKLQFSRAGRVAPVKTYKFDPTKIQSLKDTKSKS